jgi:transposase
LATITKGDNVVARRRLRVIDYQRIIEELRDGRSARDLADRKVASRNKVRDIREIAGPLGWLDSTVPAPLDEEIQRVLMREMALPKQISSVEPYRKDVEAWIKEGHSPQQIYQALRRQRNFQGSVGAVKRFARRLEKPEAKAVVVLHFEPGEAAQVDFGAGPELEHPVTGKRVRTHIFVMTLCHSRHMYAELVWNQKVETWLKCHHNAFEFFGGVPRRVIIDNLKSAITQACHRDPEVQRSYAELAKGYEFTIVPCRPRTPRHKGRVERGVGYVKGNFFPLRSFRNIVDANQQLMEWVLGEAGNRIHGTTHEMPLSAFAEREKVALLALPSSRPELSAWSKAKLASNCHLTVDSSFYSAPYHHIGETLEVRMRETMVEIYRDHQLLAMHPRATRPRTFRTSQEHYPPEKVAYLQKTPQWCIRQAKDVGFKCYLFVEMLLGDRVLDRLPAVHGVLGLRKKYGSLRLEAACSRALDYDNVAYRTVRSILEKGLDQVPERCDPTGQLELPMITHTRFGRDIGLMLTS